MNAHSQSMDCLWPRPHDEVKVTTTGQPPLPPFPLTKKKKKRKEGGEKKGEKKPVSHVQLNSALTRTVKYFYLRLSAESDCLPRATSHRPNCTAYLAMKAEEFI